MVKWRGRRSGRSTACARKRRARTRVYCGQRSSTGERPCGRGGMGMEMRTFTIGDRVRERVHGPGTVVGHERDGAVSVQYDAGVWFTAWPQWLEPIAEPPAQSGWTGSVKPLDGVAARADLVAILEELRALLLRIDEGTVDSKYVDFGAMADRLGECIRLVEHPAAGD